MATACASLVNVTDASACAVFGGTYILGSDGAPTSMTVGEDSVTLSIAAHPRSVTAKHLITPPGYTSSPAVKRTTAHLVAVVSAQPPVLRKATATSEDDEAGEEDDDTAVIAFPATPNSPLVRALIMGEGTGSCPRGQWVVYLSCQAEDADPKALLEPFLARVAPEGVEFVAAYLQHKPEPEEDEAKLQQEEVADAKPSEGADTAPADSAPDSALSPLVVLRPYAGAHTLTEGLDHEAREAARAFAAVCEEEFFPHDDEPDEEDE